MELSLKSQLITSIEDNNLNTFQTLLQNSELSSLTTSENQTIFHDIGKMILPEASLIKFIESIFSYLESKFSKSSIIELLNVQTSEDHLTALHLSIQNQKKVRTS